MTASIDDLHKAAWLIAQGFACGETLPDIARRVRDKVPSVPDSEIRLLYIGCVAMDAMRDVNV
jgi:hypothetical protein